MFGEVPWVLLPPSRWSGAVVRGLGARPGSWSQVCLGDQQVASQEDWEVWEVQRHCGPERKGSALALELSFLYHLRKEFVSL